MHDLAQSTQSAKRSRALYSQIPIASKAFFLKGQHISVNEPE